MRIGDIPKLLQLKVPSQIIMGRQECEAPNILNSPRHNIMVARVLRQGLLRAPVVVISKLFKENVRSEGGVDWKRLETLEEVGAKLNPTPMCKHYT